MNDSLLTPIPIHTESLALPARFPSPFANPPHPLAEQAAKILQQRLATAQQEKGCKLCTADYGKMFGVLVVKNHHGELAFLSAFSGTMDGQWQLPGFVPPICDQTVLHHCIPDGVAMLAEFDQRLTQMEQEPQRLALHQQLTSLMQQRDQAILTMKTRHQAAKEKRHLERQRLQQQGNLDLQQRAMAVLANASKRHDREAAELKRHWRQQLQQVQQQLDSYEQQIQELKTRRNEAARQLNKQVFEAYQLHNFLGERKAIGDLFPNGLPPGGSGDCAAPKLIHYAASHQLHPIALAEFWWGASPATGVRHHGQFYPSCRGKCRPILPFMLRGIAMDAEPSHITPIAEDEPKIIYEDAHLIVINKPAGLLSIPGKQCKDSVFSRLQQRYADHPELKLVHRLDRTTSGLLLVAKNLRMNNILQQQFMRRTVEKRYEALLDGLLPPMPNHGEINLPLRVDLDDRPRQMVCHQHGKQARTLWQRIGSERAMTRVFFYPQTGRTHQLRLHAAHRDGLNTPIVGDDLYGRPSSRMMLHAQRLSFIHPVTHEPMVFEAPTPF